MTEGKAPEKPPTHGPAPVIDNRDPWEEGRDIFFAAVETTRMPMTVTDPNRPDNPIIFCNRAFERMTGYAQDEIIGRNCRFLQGPDTDRETLNDVRAALAKESEIAVEILNYRKNGSTFWNALYVSPVYGHDGKLLYFFGSQLDVSRRRDAEDALRHAQKMEAVGQLTGGIAHDFNNLLQVILGYADVLRGRANGDARLARAVDAIAGAATRGATLTQQLLAFARKQDLRGRQLNLNALIDGMAALADATANSGIRIERRFADDLWNCRIDPVQAEMALLNLVANARDAMPDGGTITISTANAELSGDGHLPDKLEPGRYVTLTVVDSGTGIDPAAVAHIFEPFYSTKEIGKGTGLGLAMVWGFVRQSGGTIDVGGGPGEGARFTLYFPADHGRVEKVEEPHRRGDWRGSERVLVVEDQPDVGELARTVLEELGYAVELTDGPAAALSAMERGRFDLLFSDIIMPGQMNGVALAREARRRMPKLKVLLATGYADQAMANDTQEFDVLNKPYRGTELGRRVRTALDGPTGAS